MISDCLHEFVVNIVPSTFILQVRIGVRRNTLCIIEFHVYLVSTEHINDDEINYRLFPSHWIGKVEIFDGPFIVILHPKFIVK